jgi:protein tyrosine phosphatase (PTP) superfamily phosphohydrolase (DUF442 family)
MEKKLLLDYLLRPHWPTLAIAFVAILFEGLADLLEPWPIKIVLDYVIGSKQPPQWLGDFITSSFGADKFAMLNLAVAAVVVVAVVGAISTYTEKYLTSKVGQEVMCDLRRAVYHHIQRLSLSFYDRSRVGDLISRVTVDIDTIQDFVSSALLGIVVDALKLAGMVALMFYLNWRFTLIALLVAPALFVEVYSLTRRIKSAARDLRKKESEIVSVVEESLSSIRVVKAFAAGLVALGVKTVISLRHRPDERVRQSAERAGMRYINLPMNVRGYPPADLAPRFLALVNDPENWPVYVYCHGGRHRTGVMTAIYRMAIEGWEVQRAYAEMRQYGFYKRWGHGPLKAYVLDYYCRLLEGASQSNYRRHCRFIRTGDNERCSNVRAEQRGNGAAPCWRWIGSTPDCVISRSVEGNSWPTA